MLRSATATDCHGLPSGSLSRRFSDGQCLPPLAVWIAAEGRLACLTLGQIYIFGGHDGRRSLSDLHMFDTESMNWSKAAVSGRAPLAGSRHTATLVGDRLFVFGATDSGSFRDMHVLEIEALHWTQVAADGQAPISRSRHTASLVGSNLLLFGGVGGASRMATECHCLPLLATACHCLPLSASECH